MPSFYSERTAEYSLVPKFLDILTPLGSVVPMFFLRQREDTHVALESLDGQRFHLIAFFARRPKIDTIESQTINGKINSRLFRVAQSAAQLGVSTFCGITLTNNIFDQARAESLWFDISDLNIGDDEQFSCEVTEDLRLNNFYGQIKPSNHEAILSRISSSRILNWRELTMIMRELPQLADGTQGGSFMFLSQTWRFRPVYFAIRLP